MEQLTWHPSQIQTFPSQSTILLKKPIPFTLQTIQFITSRQDRTLLNVTEARNELSVPIALGSRGRILSEVEALRLIRGLFESGETHETERLVREVRRVHVEGPQGTGGETFADSSSTSSSSSSRASTLSGSTGQTTSITTSEHSISRTLTTINASSQTHFAIFNNRVIIKRRKLQEISLYFKTDALPMEDFFLYHEYVEYRRATRHGRQYPTVSPRVYNLMANPAILDSLSSTIHHIGYISTEESQKEQLFVKKNDKRTQLVLCFKWKDDERDALSDISRSVTVLPVTTSHTTTERHHITSEVVKHRETDLDEIEIEIDELGIDASAEGSIQEARVQDGAPELLVTVDERLITKDQNGTTQHVVIKERRLEENSTIESTTKSTTSGAPSTTTSSIASQQEDSLSDYYSLIFYIEKDVQFMSLDELRVMATTQKEAIAAKDAIIQREEAQIERLSNELGTIRFQFETMQEQHEALKYQQIQMEKHFRREMDAKELELERIRAEFDVAKESRGCCVIL